MAAKTTVKVATLSNAAKNDFFNFSEDNFNAELNVLSNDAGAAKLYSIAQISGSSDQQFPVQNFVKLTSGAIISMNENGTVHYEAGADLNTLAEGEVFTDTFTYTVQMANGALSTAVTTVQIVGVNDVPTLASVETVSIYDTSANDVPAAVTGQLVGLDIDHGAVLSYSGSTANDYGTLTVNEDGSYSFLADADALNTLTAGQNQLINFDVTVMDEYGASANTSLSFNFIGADEVVLNPNGDVTTYIANHGLTTINGKQVISGFDGNDILNLSGNYTNPIISDIVYNGLDSTEVSATGSGKQAPLDVILLGYTDFDATTQLA